MAERGEEQEWISRSRKGDPEAFAALVQRYQRMIDAVLYRMTGSLADAEDLAQDTFIQAYRQLERFRGEAGFSSWLYRIAVNTCLNWQKTKSRRDCLHRLWANEQPQAQNDGVASGTEGAGQLANQVHAALLRLPAKQRAAVILTTYENLSHAGAARVLGCSETTVSWRLFAARRKLKRFLSKPEADHSSTKP